MLIDQTEKINYYKELLMTEMAKQGMFPSQEKVAKTLDNINTRLAVFQYKSVAKGEIFDTAKFNADMKSIAADLRILYKLVTELSNNRMKALREYATTHLTQLQAMADRYENKTKFEIDSTSLGETIFFQTGSYKVAFGNGTAVISLGEVRAKGGSRIACIFDSDVFDANNVVFSFNGGNCSPYSINRDFFKVPGQPAVKEYPYLISSDTSINTDHMIAPDGLELNNDNTYYIFGGKNKIATSTGYSEKSAGTILTFTNPSKLEFYVKNASFISFNYNMEPITKNFTGAGIDNPDEIQKIFMEVDAGFAIDIITDGVIYAERKKGYIRGDKLFYSGLSNLEEYLVQEYTKDDEKVYDNVTVTVSNIKYDVPFSVNIIALKQMIASEEVY